MDGSIKIQTLTMDVVGAISVFYVFDQNGPVGDTLGFFVAYKGRNLSTRCCKTEGTNSFLTVTPVTPS